MSYLTPFNPQFVKLTRIRRSTTQGEVLVCYAGTEIAQFGDTIIRDEDGEYRGHSDAFWLGIAKRYAIARKLAAPETAPAMNPVVAKAVTYSTFVPSVLQVRERRETVGTGLVESRKHIVRERVRMMLHDFTPETGGEAQLAAALQALIDFEII